MKQDKWRIMIKTNMNIKGKIDKVSRRKQFMFNSFPKYSNYSRILYQCFLFASTLTKKNPVGPVFYLIMHGERLCPWKHLFIGRGLKQHRYKKYPSAFYTSIYLIFKSYLLWCTEKISIGIKFFLNVSNFSPFHRL